jgi:uncharacterized protein
MDQLIPRPDDIGAVQSLMEVFPVTVILGPRQCGKTTLARLIEGDHHFDLENPRDLARLATPQLTLEALTGVIVIDEVQRMPELFPLLRYLTDTVPNQKYLLLGSASPDLIKQSSETLAGRVGFHELTPFVLGEVGSIDVRKLWLRGGFPLSYLAQTDDQSDLWRENYIMAFLERDIPQLGISIPSEVLRRFWIMISHYHGQLLNASELGRSFGITDKTIRRYISILTGTFMVRLLQPWHENVGKRVVRSPKLYLRDSGIFHTLQSIDSTDSLHTHSKLGASWEGFVLEQAISMLGITEPYHWRTHTGSELDLFWFKHGKKWGIEVKFGDAPRMTKSLHSILADLEPDHVWIVYPGNDEYRLHDRVSVIPLKDISTIREKIR